MRAAEKALLYWNTVRHLRPVQIAGQIGKRVSGKKKEKILEGIRKMEVPKRRDARILIPALDCREEYLDRFKPGLLLENKICLLHECHEFDGKWEVPGASHLWNYNLHYLEFLIPLAACYSKTGERRYFDKWKEYMESWMAQSGGDSLEPYAISMRIPNMLACMELLDGEIRDTGLGREMSGSIYRQYRFLLKNKERSLLANHYFENLKAIVICSAMYGEREIYERHFRLLEGQIGEQVLRDGMHFERSFLYHRIVLEDMLRLCVALPSLGRAEDAARLAEPVSRMAYFLEAAERGFDTIPLFNDAGNNVAKDRDSLAIAAKTVLGGLYGGSGGAKPGVSGGRAAAAPAARADAGDFASPRAQGANGCEWVAFPDSGYYKLDTGRLAVLFDCGEIGPPYMGGHAHCDCLSFELALDGEKVFCNSGTGQYQGRLRPYFRSTMAHNASMIDGREQSELWGEHRAARRIRSARARASGEVLTGEYASYLGDWFARSLTWRRGDLVIRDFAEARDKGSHTMRVFFHLAPGFRYEEAGCGRVLVRRGDVDVGEVMVPRDCSIAIHRDGKLACCAEDFGRYRRKEVLEVRKEFRGRVRLETRIRIQRD